ncbi:cell division protein ZapA [Paenibacillus sp. TRM 82003]|nr:cell division protein ZapA [Paenibacillus sp. TRM 82003]
MTPEEKTRTTVSIFGTTYKMVGTFSQAYLNQISKYVNERMEVVAKSNPRLDSQRVGVLAMIQIADEYFQLQGKWHAVENERSQSKLHIEELRKAFELTEEKERGKSNEVRHLMERIERLEKENARIGEEAEMASLTWAERVEEWEAKYAAAANEAAAATASLEARVRELEAERSQLLETAATTAARPEPTAQELPAKEPEKVAADPELAEKYLKLQEEYEKLQIEYNEWIQLTMSETQ